MTELSSTTSSIESGSTIRQEPPILNSQGGRSETNLIFPSFLDAGASLLRVTVIALFVLTFVAQPFRIPSESMERTLLVGDFLLVNKGMYASPGGWQGLLPYQEINRGDVVVFHFPLDPAQPLVKRVIGLPGDHIHIQSGQVYVNGKRMDEPYVVFESSVPNDQFPSTVYSDPGIDPQWWREMRERVTNGDLIVPPGRYFVLGDNRNHSRDSRYWGFVPRKSMMGRPFLIYFSLREPSTTDVEATSNDRLGHDGERISSLQSFARWNRMFHVVR